MRRYKSRKGVALIASMIFLMIFATWMISVNSSSNVNLQLAQNQRKISSALCAAESGLELGKYVISSYTSGISGDSEVTDAQADTVWEALWQHVRDNLNDPSLLDGQTIGNPTNFTDAVGDGVELIVPEINFGSYDTGFQLRLCRYGSDPFTVKLQAIGLTGTVERKIVIDYAIQKDAAVLKYAVAGRGRMWLTGNSTIYGDIFSTWATPPGLPETDPAPDAAAPLPVPAVASVRAHCWLNVAAML